MGSLLLRISVFSEQIGFAGLVEGKRVTPGRVRVTRFAGGSCSVSGFQPD
jgi:hypothetical protein